MNPTIHPTKHMSIEWLAGLLEGEGSFLAGSPSYPSMSCISLQMTDEDIVSRVADIFGVTYFAREPNKSHYKRIFVTRLRGKRAIDWMIKLHPYMGQRRQQQIQRAIDAYHTCRSKRFKLTDSNIQEIQKLLATGMIHREIAKTFNVSRSRITYIANGYCGTKIANTLL